MNLKETGLYNLKIHYIWTFFSSILFLSPIITLYYKIYGLDLQDILVLTSIFTLLLTILELPTSTIGDTIGRVKVMKMSVLSSLLSYVIIFLFPSIYGFYIAIFFSALGNALWSGTGQAKLQEDLESAEKTKEFGKIIGRLIALQNIGKLFTPIIIYFVLKYFINGYSILAFLDILFFVVATFFVFKFVEIGEIKKSKDKKEFWSIQKTALKNGFSFLIKSKPLLMLLILMILGNNLGYLARVLLPSLVENGVEDFLSSYVIWFSVLAGIIGNLIPKKLGDKFSWEKSFTALLLLNSILHFLAYLYVDNSFILTLLFVSISFTVGIYCPIRNHLLMEFLTIKEKATVRSLFLMIFGFFEFIILFSLSSLSLQFGLLFLSILIFVGFVVGVLFFKRIK